MGGPQAAALPELRDCEANYSQGRPNRALPHPVLLFVYQEARRLTLVAHVTLAAGRKRFADLRFLDPPGLPRSHVCQGPRVLAGTTYDELVQWMVQDASIGR